MWCVHSCWRWDHLRAVTSSTVTVTWVDRVLHHCSNKVIHKHTCVLCVWHTLHSHCPLTCASCVCSKWTGEQLPAKGSDDLGDPPQRPARIPSGQHRADQLHLPRWSADGQYQFIQKTSVRVGLGSGSVSESRSHYCCIVFGWQNKQNIFQHHLMLSLPLQPRKALEFIQKPPADLWPQHCIVLMMFFWKFMIWVWCLVNPSPDPEETWFQPPLCLNTRLQTDLMALPVMLQL